MYKKILATLGPASWDNEKIRQMAEYNPYVFRINLSHEPLEMIEERVKQIQSVENATVCLDSEGAQIRTAVMQKDAVRLGKGADVKIYFDDRPCTENDISFTPVGIAKHFEKNDILRIGFEMLKVEIIETGPEFCIAKVVQSGTLESKKAVYLDRYIPLDPITPKDRQAIKIGRELGVRHFALSFASSKQDIDDFRSLVGDDSTIIAKIESRRSLYNLREIIDSADEFLIDRGDLSHDVETEKIPFVQRRIISAVKLSGKPIYVATNFLETMRQSLDPSKAELNDIVSTLLMGADGLVLAAETAIGDYPVESVKMIRDIMNVASRWTINTSLIEILEGL